MTTIPGYELVLGAPADVLFLATVGVCIVAVALGVWLSVWGNE